MPSQVSPAGMQPVWPRSNYGHGFLEQMGTSCMEKKEKSLVEIKSCRAFPGHEGKLGSLVELRPSWKAERDVCVCGGRPAWMVRLAGTDSPVP